MGAKQRDTEWLDAWIERLPLPLHVVPATAISTLFVLFSFLLRSGADLQGYPFITFFPVIMAAALLFGWRQGVLAAALSGGFAWAFFIPSAGDPAQIGATALALGFFAAVAGSLVLIAAMLQHTIGRLAVAREQNRVLAETRGLLFHELQHRVSNNLQMAAGMLALQGRQIVDAEALAAIGHASRRLEVIGTISREIYRPDGASRTLTELLEPLCQHVVEASGTAIELRFRDVAGVLLPANASIPVALIVAEAVANAIEHGLAHRQRGMIRVDCLRDERDLRIEVHDDGEGLSEGFDVEADGNLGLRIAMMFAAQIGARFQLLDGKGATARLTLPV